MGFHWRFQTDAASFGVPGFSPNDHLKAETVFFGWSSDGQGGFFAMNETRDCYRLLVGLFASRVMGRVLVWLAFDFGGWLMDQGQMTHVSKRGALQRAFLTLHCRSE